MKLKLVLMGTGPFAVPSFEAIRSHADFEIKLVVVRPPASDSKKRPIVGPVLQWATTHQLTTIAPSSINDAESISMLREVQADCFVVCDYGQILSHDAIRSARLGGINLHGSLLPRHRGAAPVQWAILSGDSTTGVTVIHLTTKLDGGPILAQKATNIEPNDTNETLEKRLSLLGIEATIRSLNAISRCQSIDEVHQLGRRQDSTLATPAPRLKKSDGQLDFRRSAEWIERQIRALQPWPGTFGILQIEGGKELRVVIREGKALPKMPIDALPGEVLWGCSLTSLIEKHESTSRIAGGNVSDILEKTLLAVVCQDSLLALPTIHPSGKRQMTAQEFLAGYGQVKSMRFAPSLDA